MRARRNPGPCFLCLPSENAGPNGPAFFSFVSKELSLGRAGIVGWTAAAARLRSAKEIRRTLAIPTLLVAAFLVALSMTVVAMRVFAAGVHLLAGLCLAIVWLAWRVTAAACACTVLFGVTTVIAVSVVGTVMPAAMPLAGAVPGMLAFVRPSMRLVLLRPCLLALAVGAVALVASKAMRAFGARMRRWPTIGGPFAAFVARLRRCAAFAPGLAIAFTARRAILALSGAGGPVIAWVIVRLIPATLAATVRAAAMACALTGVAAVVAVGVLAPARCGSNGFSANIVDQFNRLLHELFDGFDLAFFGRIAQ